MKITMPDGEIVESKLPVFKTPYNHDTDFEARRTGTYNDEPSLTKQEFKEETDINVIMERFTRGGALPPPVLPEHFMDLAERPTYFDTQQRLAEANRTFYMLPAELRAEFLNDPTRWADAVVKAVDSNDRTGLAALGVEVPPERPQEPVKPTSPDSAAPTAEKATTAPGASGDPPKSDSGK